MFSRSAGLSYAGSAFRQFGVPPLAVRGFHPQEAFVKHVKHLGYLNHPARFILCLMLAAGLSMFSISCAHPCRSGQMNQENHEHHMAAHSDMDSHTENAEHHAM